MKYYYNSLSSRVSSWGLDSASLLGSTIGSKISRASIQWFASLLFLLLGVSNYAQTTLISSSGNGGFETGSTFTANGWTAVNSTTDSWILGTVSGVASGARCAYISSTPSGAQTWSYSQISTIQHLYYDVTIPAGQPIVTLTFKWKAGGEGGATSDWDNLKFFWGTVANVGTPVANTAVSSTYQVSGPGATSGMYKLSSAAYNSETISFSGIPGSTYRLVLSWKSDISDIVNPPAAVDDINLQSAAPSAFTAVSGGLWSSPATWGGSVPGAGNDIVIPAGMIVTVDQVTNYRDLTIGGTVQWNGTANAMNLAGNLTVNSGGSFLPYTSSQGVVAVNIAGNFQNNGYANLALASLTFNGSGSTLSGTGTFQGDSSKGIIRALNFTNTGSNAISTSSSFFVTAGLTHTAGSLNTNGKLALDNTVQLYGTAFNTSVANLAVTNMGTLYNTAAPVVFGVAVTQWTSGGTSASNTRYVSGGNVYVGTSTAGLGTTAPTHTSGLGGTNNNLLWLGTTGTLGTPWPYNAASVVGTQYFYGGNLYVATSVTTATTPPTHTSGNTAGYLYVGTPAQATVNYSAATQTVRSLNLTNAGSGYSSNPSVAFSVGVAGGTGSGAAATAVVFQRIDGPASFLVQKSGGAATISGGLTINSDAGAGVLAPANEQASSGVGAISTSNGGVNYTVAPAVGFALPTALNLIQNPGSGYTTTPTVTVTGGTLISGTALTTANFTIAVNAGQVQAVYLNAATTATYSTLPTLSLTTSPGVTATLAFPAGCLPSATPVLGANGQIVNFTMNSSGFGYVAAPTVGISGGTFTTAATAPTARVALYNLTLNNFNPSPAPVAQGEDAAIPANRKINTLTLGSFSSGFNVTNNLILYGTSPLSLTASGNAPGSVIDLGGNNLLFTWNGYGGVGSTFGATNAYIKNGSMTLTGRGGSSTFNYPFAGTFTWFAGNAPTANSTGSSVTRVTVSDTAAPSNATIGTSLATGGRAFRVQYANIGTTGFSVLPVTGTLPTVTMNFNSNDALTAYTQDLLLISDSPSLTGPWSARSVASGSGAITSTTTGSRVTAGVAPGPIVPTGDNYYAWSVSAPTITDFAPLTLCSNSGTFTITGTNLTGVTNLKIGGTAVTSFTVVSPTSITGVAGNGTSGFVSLEKAGNTVTGTQSITINASPAAPSVSPTSASIVLGGDPNLTASGSGGTFNWYNAATNGTLLHTGPTYNFPVCSSTTLYVAENNGSCDGPRTAVPITVQATVITASTPTFCGTGGNTTLTVTPVDPSINYTWTSISGAPLDTTTGTSVVATVSASSDFQVSASSALGGCTATSTISVSVYPLPNANVTTSATGVCPGTSSTINSGLSAGNFSSLAIGHSPKIAPVTAVTLATGGAAVVAQTSGTLDDGGWGAIPIGFNFNFFGTNYSTINIGTNGTATFGTYNGTSLGDFTFTTLPSTGEPFNLIAILAMDNNLTNAGVAGGTIKYWTEGTSPNQRFIISYENVREHAADLVSTAQAIFYQTTGVVEVHVTSSTNIDRNKLVGINNGDGTIGVLAYASGTAATTTPQNPITNPFAYRFSPPSNYNITWSTVGPGNVLTTVASGLNVFSYTATPSVTTTYNLSYTNTTTGCTNPALSDQVTMTVLSNVAPSTTAVASASTICLNGSSNLSLTGNVNSIGNTDGLTYQWQVSTDAGATWTNISGATAATTTVSPLVPSSYQCLVATCLGTPVASSAVSVGFTNSIETTTPATRCGTGAISLSATTASPGAAIVWYAAQSGGTALFTGGTYSPTVSSTTTFYVAAETTGPACSSARVAVVATVTTPPAIVLTGGNSTTICNGSSATLITDADVNYDTFVVSPSATGSYSGGGVFNFNPTATTVYTVTATQSAGQLCGTTFTYTVNVNTFTVSASTSAATICLGQPVTLSSTTTAATPTYSWAIGAGPVLSTAASFSDTPTALGANVYTVTVTNTTTGCSLSANTTVTTQNAGAAIGTQPAATQTRCLAGTATFTVAATGVNLTYQWRKGTTNLTNGGGISGATTATLTLTGLVAGDAAADYNVVVSSDCGTPVTSTDAALVVVSPLANINASATTICTGTAVTLTENGGTATSWVWSGGSTTNPYIVSPTVTQSYTVTATSQLSGCTATASVTINVNQTPGTITVAAEGLSFPYAVCIGSPVKMNATDGGYTNTAITNESFDAISSLFTLGTVSSPTATLDTTIKTQGSGSVVFNSTATGADATYSLNTNIDLSTSQVATISFSQIASMEGAGTASFDYGYVQYSTDGGTTWTTFNSSAYSGTADNTLFDAGAVRFSTRSYADWKTALYDTVNFTPIAPTNALWKNETFTIPAAALTSQFRIRFRYTTDGSVNYLGWWIDNVVLTYSAPVIPQYSWTASPATTLYTDAAQTTVYNPLTDFAPAVYANPTANTVFTATVTNGPCSNSTNATVSIKALPSFTVSDKEVCSDAGGVIVSPVGGDGANTYIWSPTAGLSGGNIAVDGTSTNIDVIIANPSSTASYSVTANNNTTGCVSTPQAFTVTVNPQAVSAASTPPTRIKSATTSTTFTVSSLNAVAYQWQVREGSGSFIDIDGGYSPVDGESYSGATTATLTINNISELMTGFSYRCKVKGAGNCAFVIPSNAQESVLTVQTIGFVANFPADFTLCESGDATFSIQTTGGTPENYIWQVSTNNGPFTNITDGFDAASGFEYSGATTANLDITGITYSATNSYRYQVAIDDESVTSDFASLKVNKTIVGTQAPQNNSLCSLAATSSFTAKATGTISGVTWEYGTSAAGPWSPVANGTPSNITYSSSLPAALTTDGERTATLLISSNATTPVVGGPYFYRATFLRENGECADFTTTSGQLDITTPVLSSQPASTSVIVTNSATFTVGISGAATYQWQYSTSPSSGFQDIPAGSQTGASYSGTTSATLTVTTSGTTPFAANNYYRARVTSGGCIVYSNAAQLTVTDYCAPTYVSGSVSGNSITRVVLGTLTNNSGASTSPFYTFYSNVTVPDLIKLSTNSVAVTVGANANQYTGVWIDFNQNGTFEASEGVVSTTNTVSGGVSTLSVLIPSTATVGQTRMRVRGGDDVAMLTSQACGATNSVVGETEDYLVNVIATPAPTVVSYGAASACELSTITITGTNFYAVTAVLVNGTPVSSFTVVSSTSITATLGAGTTSGVVSVTAAGGTGSGPSLTVNPLPAIPVITGGGAICGVTTTSINATNGGDGTMYYQGTTINGTSTATTGAQTITTSGTYYFRALSAAGCWGPQASTTVQFLTAPVAPTTTSYTICPGGVIPVGQGLTSTSVGSNVTGSQTIFFNVTAQPVEVNAAPGNVFASATMTALPAGATVTGITIKYDGLAAIGGSWRSEIRLGLSGALVNDAAAGDGAPGSAGALNYLRTTTTGITATIAGGTVNLLYWDSSADNAGADATFTTGTAVASVVVNYSYPNPSPISWYTASTGGTAIGTGTPFNPIGVAGSGLADSNTPGTYPFYAEVNNGNCTSTRTLANIIVQAAGPFTASSIAAAETSGVANNDGAICSGAAVTLTAGSTGGGGGLSYDWKVGGTTVSTAASFTITPALTATTTYDLTISDACGQTTTVSRTITVNSIPTVSISSLTPAQARICGTGSVSMTATGASTYVWTPTTGLTPTTGSPVTANPSATTSYTVVGTDVNGCVSAPSAAQVITVGPAVTMTVAATPDAICSGSTSVLSATANTSTSPYCTPVYGSFDGTDGIFAMALRNAAGTTTLYTRSSGATALPGYDNQTALTTTTLSAGTSYQISATIGTSGGNVAAFIDFNKDGDFTDSGETILPSTAVASSATTSLSFLVPANAVNGTTRLRVVERFSAAAAACNTTGFGETEDYTVTVSGGVNSLNYSWTGSNGFTSSLANPTTPVLTANASYSVTATEPTSGCFATGTTSVSVTNCGVTQLSNCGSTPALPSVNTRIFAANTVSGASAYRFRVAVSTAPTSYFYAVTAYPSFRLTDVVGLTPTYGTTYNVDIQTEYTVGASTVVGAYGPMCTVTTQAPTNITVQTNQCGQTLAAVNSKVYVNGVAGATMYTYRIAKQSAPTQYGYIETPYSNFRLTAPLTSGAVVIEHNTIYLVSVSVTTSNGVSNFNGECIITTPEGPITLLQPSQCGDDETPYVIPTKSTKVYADSFVSGATYTFKLEQYDGSTLLATKYATSPINYFDCNMFVGDNALLPNTKYNVYVSINYYGQGDYDRDCVIRTPAALKQEDMITDFKAVAYPNPFANNFMIDVKSSSQSSVNLKVYDMIGRLIEQRDVRMSDLETTTIGDRYPSGVYNVVVTQESTVQTVRVVKR